MGTQTAQAGARSDADSQQLWGRLSPQLARSRRYAALSKFYGGKGGIMPIVASEVVDEPWHFGCGLEVEV